MRTETNSGTATDGANAQGLLAEDIEALHEQCRDRLGAVETDLIEVADRNVEISDELINRVFRAFHSVKGAAGYLHDDSLKRLTHASESVLSEVRQGHIELSSALAEALLSAVDRMQQMVGDGGGRRDVAYSAELAGLNAILYPPGRPAPEAEKADDRRAARAVPDGPPRARRLKVLLVEDDFTSRVLLQGLLARHGECHVAVSGREAVDAFGAARQAGSGYDLVCMDIRMPGMDGTAAVREIRSLEEADNVCSSAGAKIFMTTGVRDIKAVTASFSALCDAYLFKPIDGEQLESHLRSFRLIGQRQA